jgi:hypothetical protein
MKLSIVLLLKQMFCPSIVKMAAENNRLLKNAYELKWKLESKEGR